MKFTELFEEWERLKKKRAALDYHERWEVEQELYKAEDALNAFFKDSHAD